MAIILLQHELNFISRFDEEYVFVFLEYPLEYFYFPFLAFVFGHRLIFIECLRKDVRQAITTVESLLDFPQLFGHLIDSLSRVFPAQIVLECPEGDFSLYNIDF